MTTDNKQSALTDMKLTAQYLWDDAIACDYQGFEAKVIEALSKLRGAGEPVAVPDGWALVPIEPTLGMLVAGNHGQLGEFSAAKCWADMMAAFSRSSADKTLRVPQGWQFEVMHSDGRVWLTIRTPHGASATLSAAEESEGGGPTIARQVLDYLRDSLAVPMAAQKPVEGDARYDALYEVADKMYIALCQEKAVYDPPIRHVADAVEAYEKWSSATAAAKRQKGQ